MFGWLVVCRDIVLVLYVWLACGMQGYISRSSSVLVTPPDETLSLEMKPSVAIIKVFHFALHCFR